MWQYDAGRRITNTGHSSGRARQLAFADPRDHRRGGEQQGYKSWWVYIAVARFDLLSCSFCVYNHSPTDPVDEEPPSDAPLRKRQRTDAEEIENMLAASRVDSMTFENPQYFAPERDCCVRSNSTRRDENYYRGDGDCIIRVENTLFKVRALLRLPLRAPGLHLVQELRRLLTPYPFVAC